MRDHILLYMNGKPARIWGDDAALTLAEFLRTRQRMTGTKVVCAEGDCGACAVLVGRPVDGRLQFTAVNSCILLMFQLDATHIVTVEGLCDGATLHPVQEAMVKCHGAQCGFCTPGMVVSLCDLMDKTPKLDAHAVRRGLVGNLCRCTGYDSIVHAALAADRSAAKPIESMYPSAQYAAPLQTMEGEEVSIETPSLRFFKPAAVASACRFLRENPDCTIVSGATDLGVQRNKGTRQFNVVMSTVALRSLQQIQIEADHLMVGAGATLSDLECVTAAALPELNEYLAWFGSPLIKNSATLAGNLANASPIGDLIPPLIVLDAGIEATSESGPRWIKIADFYAGYRKTTLRLGEFITRVRIPLPAPGGVYKLYKISKRKDLDISAFNAAIWMRPDGGRIADIRIAYGGVAPIVRRLNAVEQFLTGRQISSVVFQEAGRIARGEVSPISDVRGSQEYRGKLAENILLKFWHDLGSNGERR